MHIITTMNYPDQTPQQLIVEIRKVSGMTDTEIADKAGMSQSTISRLRAGTLMDTSSENWRSLLSLREREIKKMAAA
jgi:predicted transcriptional regulator